MPFVILAVLLVLVVVGVLLLAYYLTRRWERGTNPQDNTVTTGAIPETTGPTQANSAASSAKTGQLGG